MMPGDGSLGADSYSFDSDRCNLVTSHSTCANIKKANSLSVILDMMEVESYRATEANHHRKLQQEATQIEAQKPAEIVAIGGA